MVINNDNFIAALRLNSTECADFDMQPYIHRGIKYLYKWKFLKGVHYN